MKKNTSLIKGVSQVVEGLKVEKWLRGAVMKSMFSMKYLPNTVGDISDAATTLTDEDKNRFILLMINAHERVCAQSDFMGVVGIPLAVGFLTVISAFDVSAQLLAFFFLIAIAYLCVYFYYRLMKAATSSILKTLRIAKEY